MRNAFHSGSPFLGCVSGTGTVSRMQYRSSALPESIDGSLSLMLSDVMCSNVSRGTRFGFALGSLQFWLRMRASTVCRRYVGLSSRFGMVAR